MFRPVRRWARTRYDLLFTRSCCWRKLGRPAVAGHVTITLVRTGAANILHSGRVLYWCSHQTRLSWQTWHGYGTGTFIIKPVFHWVNSFARTEKKATWLAGDKDWRHHHPIALIFCVFARKNRLNSLRPFSTSLFRRRRRWKLLTKKSFPDSFAAEEIFSSFRVLDNFQLLFYFSLMERKNNEWKFSVTKLLSE